MKRGKFSIYNSGQKGLNNLYKMSTSNYRRITKICAEKDESKVWNCRKHEKYEQKINA